MQTFMPCRTFKVSAHCLDPKRLGKQRVEVKQILNALEAGGGWSNHPAVRMWEGYIDALKLYGNTIIQRWIDLGYNNTMPLWDHERDPKMPPWMGSYRFHLSHQSNLLRKDFEYYRRFWPDVPADLEYVWPVRG